MKVFYYKRNFELPDYLFGGVLPDRFTFATTQRKLPPQGSLLIVEDLYKNKFYLVKVKSKGKITTFEHRISCLDVREIKFSLGEVLDLLHLRKNRFTEKEKIVLITEKRSKFRQLRKYLEENNGNLDKYFNAERHQCNGISLETGIQAKDAFTTAFNIFGLIPRDYTNLTEDQIVSWELEKMSPFLESTPDGKHFIEYNSKRLYIQKVHNTPIEKCLGVDLIYNFLDEQRIILIQYKCFNYNNKKFYKSKDPHLKKELKKMLTFKFIKNCQNLGSRDLKNLRICGCPFFIKLCSRTIPNHREVPYGFYYAVCVWDSLCSQPKAYIDYGDEPKISNQLFKELVHSGLIGTTKECAKLIDKKLLKELNSDKLTLIFSEEKVGKA